MQMSGVAGSTCGSAAMNDSSTNIHYHGTNTPPTCHQDEVIFTLVNSGNFSYDLPFPADEPAGLYWYHPHVHGLSEAAVQGGASGAIHRRRNRESTAQGCGLAAAIADRARQPVPGAPEGPSVPAWDISLTMCDSISQLPPAVIQIPPKQKQFWRLLNACAGTILDVQLLYDGKPQQLQIVALRRRPNQLAGRHSQRQAGQRKEHPDTTRGRAEFIVLGRRKMSATQSW